MREWKWGIQPINWSNDDFHEWGRETPLKTCLSQMREAGFEGTELGHKFPRLPETLRPILESCGLQLVSGWHSTFLLSSNLKEECVRIREHAEFLKAMGCPLVIVCECTGAIHSDRNSPLDFRRTSALSREQFLKLAEGLEALTEESLGLPLAYHHHMGTVIQNRRDVDTLMGLTKKMGLLIDTGHLTFAGDDPLAVLRDHASRVKHVHLKNIRFNVLEKARLGLWSFYSSIKEGVFTVPGDGGIDYRPIFSELEGRGYCGWLVVEAEQDPQKANPFEYAKMARRYLKETAGL